MSDHQQQRTAIVTGAGKRVGLEIAQALLADGWRVVAHVRREDDPVVDGAERVAADLGLLDCAERIFGAAAGLPPVRLLVNNAARFAWDGFGSFAADEFDAHMAVNVRAPLLLIDELARRHPGGEALVVNLLDSKVAAPNPDFLSYTLSKQALAGLTELAARALAGRGIRVNGIAPALMLRSPGQSDENFNAMHTNNPHGTGVAPADVVAALRYLVAARAVTGEVLAIDGGQRFWALDRDVQFLEKQ
jgi:NAD(P)-dependent dehydrogenase (short-subunit alcohol dehydrogenase family)